MFACQSVGVNEPKNDAPQTNGFIADSDASLGEQTFTITMAQVEAIVEPNSVTDDISRESVAFAGIQGPFLANSTH